MSNTKKNAGCGSCEHFEEVEPDYSPRFELCNSKLTIKKGNQSHYREGFIPVEHGYSPERENKNLTCKGFTPIDWKAKYEEVKKMDIGVYVKSKDHSKVLEKNINLHSTNRKLSTWLICVSTVLLGVSGLLLIFILR